MLRYISEPLRVVARSLPGSYFFMNESSFWDNLGTELLARPLPAAVALSGGINARTITASVIFYAVTGNLALINKYRNI